MTRAAMGIVMVAALIGCAEENVPSCPEAFGHFYGDANCSVYDLSATPKRRLPENEATLFCRELLIAVPDRCQAEFDDWISCIGGQMRGSTEQQCMDCNAEYDVLLSCD